MKILSESLLGTSPESHPKRRAGIHHLSQSRTPMLSHELGLHGRESEATKLWLRLPHSGPLVSS
jgi:hypothetical protein